MSEADPLRRIDAALARIEAAARRRDDALAALTGRHAALRERVAARIAAFAAPTTIRTTTDPLPRNAVGKVLKRDLRETVTRG